MAISAWLDAVPWIAQPDGGVSWLELLVDFERADGARFLDRQLASSAAIAAPDTIAARVHRFRCAVKEALASFYRQDAAGLFGGRTSAARLRPLGIGNTVACISACPGWNHDRFARAACDVLSIRLGRTPEPQELEEGRIRAAPKVLSLEVRPPWARASLAPPGPELPDPPPDPRLYRALCPSGCGQVLDLAQKPVPLGNAWPKAWCQRCRVHRRVARGICCICNLQVRRCPCPPLLLPPPPARPL